ncbi:MAG: HAD family hydrolase [Lachnospiraceae bacterium]|nr:HAD family hydrolase [Lachnospiraceae bacterium]
MKAYKNYIFDLYGTLVDIRTDENKKDLWEKMSLFCGYYGADYSPEELQKRYLELVQTVERQMSQAMQQQTQNNPVRYVHEAYPEIPIEKVFGQLYKDKMVEPGEELVRHTGQMFRVLSTHHVRLYAGAKELLYSLKESGKKVYLLSNAQRIFTEYELFYLKIHDCFDGILISSDYGCKKPDERFFRILLDKYSIKTEESLMIGNDLDTDIRGAKQIGMDTYYIHSAISPALKREVDADYFMKRMNLHSLQKQLLGR